jgi:quercetin dioxygenase-like cupin family protein
VKFQIEVVFVKKYFHQEESMNTVPRYFVFSALFAVLATMPLAYGDPLAPGLVTPDELKWASGPTGNPQARITGDPGKPGVYMYRSRFPANYKVQPHFHPDERIGMVISGTLLVGYGEKFDESRMKVMPAGSIWAEPAGQSHFVWAKDGEVVIQIVGANGPSGTTQIQAK